MLPQSQQRKKKNSSKVNLIISFVFHTLLVVVMLYFAAKNGLLGEQIKKLSTTMVKEKPPEKPKEPEKKIEPPKEIPKVEPPKMTEEKPEPPNVAPPVVAPPNLDEAAVYIPGRTVNTESDPVQLYKGYIEYELRSKWNKPENLDDDNYTAEVSINVDKAGNLSRVDFQKGSGNAKWDDSVKEVFKEVQTIDRRPPTNFPPQVVVRFDVDAQAEPILTP